MLGVRLDPETEQALEALARRTRRTKSDIAREAVRTYVRRHDDVYLAEARRQSRLVARLDDPDVQAELDGLTLGEDGAD
ncbi:MAG TPA: ribbon-helix-helix protein, CopG family [Allosphingosinicella sp.]|jgi:RHH-type rel operon transcriptional repressor/antitoxin RelB